jgi:predicted ATPase/class 3 adenylate cyclase
VPAQPAVTTYLFTDIEGSTRLWEQEPERMRSALARHDAILRLAVERNRGVIVKTSGDGIHAAFADPLDAVRSALELQQALGDSEASEGVALRVRCGLHVGVDERRDNDFFGGVVNRAARIMGAAHGGQVLLSQTVAALVSERLPSGVTLRDLGSVRLRDLANPERVYQVVHPRLRQDFPALRSLEATPNNLPQQVTSFIGRERELAEVEKLLTRTRLLTLVGVGGIGKTRLSLQVAADVMDDYPDGVWFVELAPIADPLLVAEAAASVLGVKEEAGRPVVEALVKHVKVRRLLLILDNCEHLLDACAELARQLLQAGPYLRILSSSREQLRVAGEITYSVPALAAPDPYEKFVHTALTQYAAARLFIERAVAAQPAFEVSEQNAVAVADVCHRLDGIPLAIELAAARVRVLPVETIAARLSDRFRLLRGGDRTALPRQQTLQALIDWSYELLTERERALFRRLAVFAGSFALEAAEAVGTSGDLAESDVLDLVTRLVEKSLTTLEPQSGRYSLLETVRQYAQERLDESGEEDQTRMRHLEFYLNVAERARAELTGADQKRWLELLDLEHENLLAAHAWSRRAAGGGEYGLRLVDAVKVYWFIRGIPGLTYRLTVEALAHPEAQRRTLTRCQGLFDAGQVCCFMGRYEEAQVHLRESLEIAREIGSAERIVTALQLLGMSSLGQGDPATARTYLEEGLALARKLPNKIQLAAALNGLAQIHRVEGRPGAAEPLYEECLKLARELEDRESIAVALLNLAMVSVGRGERDRAPRMLFEVLELVEQTGSKPAGRSMLEVSAGLAAMSEEWERAARFFGMAEAQTEVTGLQRDPADDAFLSPLVAKARGALGEPTFAAAERAGRALSYVEAIEEARDWLDRRP